MMKYGVVTFNTTKENFYYWFFELNCMITDIMIFKLLYGKTD